MKQTHLIVISIYFRRLSQQNKPDFEVHFSDNKQTDSSQKINPDVQGRHNNDTGTCAVTYSTVNNPRVRKTSQTRWNPKQAAIIIPMTNGKDVDRESKTITICDDNFLDVSDFDDFDSIHKPANANGADAYDTYNNSNNVYNTANNPNNSTPNENGTVNDYASCVGLTDDYDSTAIGHGKSVIDNTYNSLRGDKEVESEYNVTNVNRKTDVHKDATYDRLDSKT